MTLEFFDPSSMNDLARFQGSFAGTQAAHADICGIAMGPTSIYNQGGYFALQDSDTGYVTLQKLANDSMYTKQWYDQGTHSVFDLKEEKQGFDPSALSHNMSVHDIAALDK